MTRRLFFPKYVRDLVDCDYLDKLPAETRAWLEDRLDEYYGATPRGVANEDQIAESNRAKQRRKQDLFSAGLRSSAEPNGEAFNSPDPMDVKLNSPRVQELLTKIRKVRPEYDPRDGRKPATFRSPLAEQRFWQLRAQLEELLK